MEKQKPVIGITIGDINGIGPEIIIKCVLDDKLFNYVSLVLYGHGKVLSYYKRLLNIERFSFNQIQSADQVRPGKLSVVNCRRPQRYA